MKPSLSFNNPHNRWKQYSFSSLFDMLHNNSLSRDKLSREGKIRNIHYGDILIKFGEVIHADTDSVPYIKDTTVLPSKGEFLNNGDIIFSDAAEDNTVGKCCELVSSQTDLFVAGLHTIATRPKIQFYPKFLAFYLNSKAFHDQLLPHIQGSKISSISRKALNSTNLVFPPVEDQQKLSHYLCGITDLINSLESEIDRLRQLKAASLQAMFPQEGETVPRLRFKGFDGDWERPTIGSLFSEGLERGTYNNLLSVSISRGVYPTEDFVKTHTVQDFSNYKTVHPGDIVYNSMRMWQGSSGVSSFSGIVSPAYTILCPNEKANSTFIAYLFKLPWIIKAFEINSQGLTKDTWNLKYPAISVIEISVPPDIREQQKIASFFQNIDKQIKLAEKKLEKLNQIKASCLDLMFV